MGAFGTEDDKVGASAQQEDAVRRFKQSLTGLAGLLEEKQNYDPRQPRRPKGTPIGGQWAPGDWSRLGGPSAAERGADMAAAAARFDAFVLKHHREIARVLGAVQALGGTAEAVGSIPVAVAGAATSETGVGLLGMALAGWMASNGIDNARAGLRALLTGEPQQTDLHRTLRKLGLKDEQAGAVEVLLSGGAGVAGARVGRTAIEKAVEAELLRRTARAFDPALALDVRSGRRSLWLDPSIRSRGDAWEAFDARRTGYLRTPNGRAFDQISRDGRVAVSNKTLDLYRETYLRTDRSALYTKLKRYIDDAARYVPRDPVSGKALWFAERRLHLLLRSGDSVAGQALQIAAAESYAKQHGIRLIVEYAR